METCAVQKQPIAIIGMGCRFPSASSPESFWTLLWDGIDAITEIPADRWSIDQLYDPELGKTGKMISRQGGFLDSIDRFDADFFEMLPSEAQRIDPQQRLVLEVAWEAIEQAGIVATELAGSQTGVFIGIRQTDYNRYLYGNLSRIDGNNPDNTYPCIVANRLSYLLDLHGPSMAIDTACSSSLVAVHLGCQSLQVGESNLVLAGGVNLNLFPEEFISRSLAGMVSLSGRCRVFDATADGYVIGEGCGIVVLKRLEDARRDQDSILAIIQGSATNHNGLSYRLSAYNALSQQALIQQALVNAGVKADEISYVEANGTASCLGDTIEFNVLKATLMQGRQLNQLCWVGSVKTNIGHLEAASGIASLIKVVLMLSHQGIPPHLHLQELNPQISLAGTSFLIPQERQHWISRSRQRFAGVSAFGLGGANAYVIVTEAPTRSTVPNGMGERPEHLLTLSAKTEAALKAMAKRYQDFLVSHPEISLPNLCFTANTGRTQFQYRLAVIAHSVTELLKQLHAFTVNQKNSSWIQGKVAGWKRPKIAFVFSDEGITWELAQELYMTQPTFQTAIETCSEMLYPDLKQSLSQFLINVPREQSSQRDFLESSAWQAHSFRQAVVFSLEYAIAELWRSWGIVPTGVLGHGVGKYVALCVLGSLSLEESLRLMVQSTAIHDLNSHPPIRLELSPSVPRVATTIQSLMKYGCSLYLPIGTIPRIVEQERRQLEGQQVWLSAKGTGQNVWQQLLLDLGQMYVQGATIDWSGFEQYYPRQRLPLPTYPFQRQQYSLVD